MTLKLYETLKYFMEAPSVTGFEEQRRKRIIEVFSKYCDTVSVDVMGNVIGVIGDGDRNVMLAGHYDQLGFMITHVDKDGFVGFKQVGGWDKRVAYGTRLKVWLGDESEDYIVGTVAVKAAHLTDKEERDKSPELKDMLIDLGVDSKEEAEKLGVKAGVVCTPYLDVTSLGPRNSDKIIGPAFDDICCVAGLVKTMSVLSENPPKNLKVHFVATVQEEIGLRGATISAYNINPWAAIATDVTHAVAPGVKPNQVGGVELGKGPVVALGGNFTRALWEIMESVAEENEIPCQRQGVPSRSGTDAWAIQVERGGTICGLISMPNRYMHSPNEVISLSDLENLGSLIAATVQALDDSDLQHNVEVYRK
ncbi:M20/M25/M40 family metallo-hydrolase [Candidatus Bathyarchaeota archaeon]|nr:M20/M25/M40 family metallo-hydrolase [Candidatus Bathyarchaeota archaeon]